VRRVETVLQNGSDLFEESEELTAYRGMVVDRFERKPDRVFFEDGRVLRVGEEIGVDKTAVWRDQLRHTIRHHLSRQEEVDGTGRSVKVLSLFFVERVHDYVPEEGSEPVLPSMFDELYREEWARSGRPVDDCPDPASLRVHYFPSTKTGIAKDTRNNASDAEFEARAYAEIIANKELLLVKSNPRAFIFSHSALKEGWDNPNVFQVCFLRHTRSDLERRQQIGRGLRLPVDETGVRVTDPSTCRLTLIVDESFADFRDGLNAEYVAAGDGSPGSGGGGGPQPEDADDEIHVRRREDKFVSPEFAELWKRIRFRASYRVTLEASVLPAAIAQSEHLDLVADIAKRANVVQSAELVYDDEGRVTTADNTVAEGRGESITVVGQRLPDLVRLVEDQLLAAKFPLQLTRPTVVSILKALPAKVTRRALDDPDRWARLVASAIRTVTIEEMLNHITYELLAESEWWDAELVFRPDEVVNPPTPIAGLDPSYGVIEAASDGANLFDHLVYDSHVEREYGAYLDNFRDRVRLFTKLPRRFRVRTPVGEYSPDWAIVVGEGVNERVYLVRETKGTLNLDDLEWDEAMRIRFARSHFLAAPEAVNYQVTTSGAGLRLDDSGDTVSDSNV
jgi:type III restriction enzyme